jgi:hypothetical protein
VRAAEAAKRSYHAHSGANLGDTLQLLEDCFLFPTWITFQISNFSLYLCFFQNRRKRYEIGIRSKEVIAKEYGPNSKIISNIVMQWTIGGCLEIQFCWP